MPAGQRFRHGFVRSVLLIVATLGATAFTPDEASAGRFKVLHSFCGGRHGGCNPSGGLAKDAVGNIYGTTLIGGAVFEGNAYALERTDSEKLKYKQIYSFCKRSETCSKGRAPIGNLIVDTQGNLYGLSSGGNGNSGVVFELSPPAGGETKWTEKVLYLFCSELNCADGAGPVGGLTYVGANTGALYDGTSPLFGATKGGGLAGRGVTFKLAYDGNRWIESVLYSFCSAGKPQCADGSGPSGGLAMDIAGNLFGTTYEGGSNKYSDPDGNGVVFQLTPNGSNWVETVLWRFCTNDKYCEDGDNPIGELVVDGSGLLYGTTRNGGGNCPPRAKGACGVAFKIVPNNADFEEYVVHKFCRKDDCRDGVHPSGGLVLTMTGDLIGTTLHGGGNDIDENGLGGGTIFDLAGSSLNVLYRFCAVANCADGEYPNTRLLTDAFGSLYGTTEFGGSHNGELLGGTVFKLKQ